MLTLRYLTYAFLSFALLEAPICHSKNLLKELVDDVQRDILDPINKKYHLVEAECAIKIHDHESNAKIAACIFRAYDDNRNGVIERGKELDYMIYEIAKYSDDWTEAQLHEQADIMFPGVGIERSKVNSMIEIFERTN